MIQEYQIRILPEQAASEEGIKRYLAKEKGLDVRTLNQVRVCLLYTSPSPRDS